MLRQKSIRALVIENGMASAESQEKPCTPVSNPLSPVSRAGPPLMKEPGPIVVVHTSDVEVMLEYLLSFVPSQNLGSLHWGQRAQMSFRFYHVLPHKLAAPFDMKPAQ